MRRETILMLVASLIAILFTGCMSQGTDTSVSATTSAMSTVVSPEGNDAEIDISPIVIGNVQYIRTGGYNEWMNFPFLVLVTSREDLEEYYAAFSGVFILASSYGNATAGWNAAVEQYDKEWFTHHVLLMVLMQCGSGSIRHEVNGIEIVAGKEYVNITSITPQPQTDDMANWHILIELNAKPLELAGVKMTESETPLLRKVYTVREVSNLFTDFIISSATKQLSADESKTVTNLTAPQISRLNFGEVKGMSLSYYYGQYDPGYDGAPIWKVTFRTIQDELLGPISYYLDQAGNVFACDYRK